MRSGWPSLRRWAARLLVLSMLAGVVYGAYRLSQRSKRVEAIPTATARQGDFLVLIRCRGSLKARRSVGVYTPTVPNLRIAWVATAGEAVKEGDVILRFDSSTAQQQLLQKDAQLKQAQATLDQASAQSKITAQQDQTSLADARYTVERADWKMQQQEIISKIAGQEAKIDMGIAQQKLKVQEATIDLHKASDSSRMASLTRQRDQVKADVDITRNRISQMELKAPISGLLLLNTNCSGAVTTADCKPYKVGDNVSSGMLLGQIPDMASLEMDVKIEEADRGRIGVNQEAIIRVDALPELAIPAKVTEVTALPELRMEYPYTRSFAARAAVPKPDPRLRPDLGGGLDVVIKRVPNAISIPSKALFTRAGKPVVYLQSDGRFRSVEVEVLARNPDEVAVSGISKGAVVALVDPTRQEGKK